ncbi:hypothetical protein Pan44_23380 [Caulifigura coniformis]|uniref:Uncharacterized protein n=1 Tax=Caulifigura coniformis TaxID=2527983 RepID=A0A517SDV6_9PLAN|nr:beta-galactosidase [Caulifigura coniformis]QDT54309.1 hypothetical protein Pan44_23380 [Caulifigura coniformis]
MAGRCFPWICFLMTGAVFSAVARGEVPLRPVRLKSAVTTVQPMTGIVLWATNAATATAPIQLEYSYMTYADVAPASGRYDWSKLDRLLEEVSGRGHQLVLRWHDTYVGQKTGVPAFLVKSPSYTLTRANSEGQPTEFPDWSSPDLRQFALEFFTEFARRYDRDPRLAFVQVGFGLWAEYHIYDGPMKLGLTFPSKEFQEEFLKHVSTALRETPWMISVDASDDYSPIAGSPELLELSFGLFDDSFNHKRHSEVNELDWNALDRTRWKRAPAGGEFSFYEKRDQKEALSATGPHGIPFEDQARRFHLSFIIGDAQPRHQKPERIRDAGLAMGYRFRVTEFTSAPGRSLIRMENSGIAPLYHHAWPAVNGVRAAHSLKGLLPGESRRFEISAGGASPKFTIDCDRLSQGQSIGFDADLP